MACSSLVCPRVGIASGGCTHLQRPGFCRACTGPRRLQRAVARMAPAPPPPLGAPGAGGGSRRAAAAAAAAAGGELAQPRGLGKRNNQSRWRWADGDGPENGARGAWSPELQQNRRAPAHAPMAPGARELPPQQVAWRAPVSPRLARVPRASPGAACPALRLPGAARSLLAEPPARLSCSLLRLARLTGAYAGSRRRVSPPPAPGAWSNQWQPRGGWPG